MERDELRARNDAVAVRVDGADHLVAVVKRHVVPDRAQRNAQLLRVEEAVARGVELLERLDELRAVALRPEARELPLHHVAPHHLAQLRHGVRHAEEDEVPHEPRREDEGGASYPAREGQHPALISWVHVHLLRDEYAQRGRGWENDIERLE
eukprot:CAMPEP_0180307912 /NCGR_PEP_ID=MMETSP0988-20121125/28183_1 /TAXON_ID=697907 /ORGANISM="non described non described, Strain CCMP2293" /LENGTH=151 /DNA_ID=CAMNT_0022291385 /DNA_START=241 /DNA_END=696 /DNA_ORIENTATION=-